MKSAFKSVKTYVISSILLAISLGIIFGQYFIILYYFPEVNPWNYSYMLMGFGFLFILIGYVGGEIITGKYRHKTKKWNDKLPEDVSIRAWKFRLPFFIPSLILLIFAAIIEIIALNMGGNLPF